MALHTELVDGRCVVHASLGLLRVVTDPHADVVSTATAPNVVGHLKPMDVTTYSSVCMVMNKQGLSMVTQICIPHCNKPELAIQNHYCLITGIKEKSM